MAKTAKKKKKKPAVEMTLFGVILSYPDLHDPKPYKGKIYYHTDALMDEDHAQLKELRSKIIRVKKEAFGEDKEEWPKGAQKKFVQDGNEREDQNGYKDRFYITASTQTPVPIVDLKGKTFNPQMVKGGMFANVAIRISAWEFDGDEGVSIYLQGVQIDTSKQSLNFGGGKSVKQMFGLDDDSDDEGDEDDDDSESDEDDEEDQPRGKKSKKSSKPVHQYDEDDEDESDDEEESDDEDDEPVKKSSKKKKKANFDEDDEE